ncbi:DMT family transporter [Aurantimonas sp. HBX-1]|uniref:DMT family transporter n=1 Tax=Aurantimonas sp. HBX-1 TaxID=2906072 RepID=UPI001F421D05|nr:DMT family transporter [Aurantimonas sp. HBX-1]UIJ71389.1 DMT family transporter [Aurantimonas sp. HBX-1]
MPLWIPITIAAAFLQNLRSSLQRQLKGRMGSTGATFARFGFGFPFAVLYLLALHRIGGLAMPAPNPAFLLAVTVGGVAQVLATFLLVYLFAFRNFMVGTAYSKTEPVQAAIFGLILLGETVTWLAFAAILAGAFGVALISVAGRGDVKIGKALFSREAGIGILSGALFGVSAVCFRGASLSLDDGGVLIRAATTLVFATGIQTLVMLAWMLLRDPLELAAVARAWRPALLVGLVGVTGSAGWFTAMTLEKVAYVRALGQIELVFTFASSVFWFREKIARLELVGCLVIAASLITLLGAAS